MSHRTPTPHYTTKSYSLLTLVIFPLALYLLQSPLVPPVLGNASFLAAIATGLLVICRVIIEWRHHCQSAAPLPASTHPALVRVQAPLAGCYFCGQVRQLQPYEISGQRRVGICQRCHHCVEFTGQHI
jgi:hypothetical protein